MSGLPSLEYPGQVKQINQAYQSIKKEAAQYPMWTLKSHFGGDSAGFTDCWAILSDPNQFGLHKDMKMTQVIPSGDIKGFISYCGPVDLKQMAHQTLMITS